MHSPLSNLNYPDFLASFRRSKAEFLVVTHRSGAERLNELLQFLDRVGMISRFWDDRPTGRVPFVDDANAELTHRRIE